jgi:hypothetical protein
MLERSGATQGVSWSGVECVRYAGKGLFGRRTSTRRLPLPCSHFHPEASQIWVCEGRSRSGKESEGIERSTEVMSMVVRKEVWKGFRSRSRSRGESESCVCAQLIN